MNIEFSASWPSSRDHWLVALAHAVNGYPKGVKVQVSLKSQAYVGYILSSIGLPASCWGRGLGR